MSATKTPGNYPFLRFQSIDKSFGEQHVVRDLTLDINQGEVFSLLGPSGCGKTTLLRMVAGFETPDSGRIILEGNDITALPPEKRPVNTVFQNYALFPHMTVRDNIDFGLRVAKVPTDERKRRVDWALELTQMGDHAHKKPTQISGGQKQRVAIARAIVNRPRILLLDEPLAALDLKLRQRMLIDLDVIHDEVGITFLFVTHDQGEAMSLSDRIAVMNEGRIEQVGTPGEIYESPVSSFTAAFIGDTNFFEGNIKSKTADGEYSRLEIDGLPDAFCYNDQPRQVGDYIYLSVRPEKLAISRRGEGGAEVETGDGPGVGPAPTGDAAGHAATDAAAPTEDTAGHAAGTNEAAVPVGDVTGDGSVGDAAGHAAADAAEPTSETESFKLNRLAGIVEDKVYLGSQTKYWVRCGEWLVVVIHPHRHYLLDRNPPTWEDPVWLSWHADDGFMLQRYRVADEQLLTLPDEELGGSDDEAVEADSVNGESLR
jgi:spermidine/putrescine transport system ATP-binding protein